MTDYQETAKRYREARGLKVAETKPNEGANMTVKKLKVLGRDDILGAPDIAMLEVDVPEWGGVVVCKPLTAAQRDRFEASVTETKNGQTTLNGTNFRAKLVARCIVDENGVRLFTNEDVEQLGKKSSKALSRVFDAVSAASGMTKEDLESLEGNSKGQDGDSSSD